MTFLSLIVTKSFASSMSESSSLSFLETAFCSVTLEDAAFLVALTFVSFLEVALTAFFAGAAFFAAGFLAETFDELLEADFFVSVFLEAALAGFFAAAVFLAAGFLAVFFSTLF